MTEFGREYGDGLYALCAEEGIDREVMQEMQCLKAAFRENADFPKLLSNMSLGKQERVEILDHALSGQIHHYLLNFLKILVERGAIHEFEDCLLAFTESFHINHHVVEAQVTTARPLDQAQREQLIEKLKQMTGKEVVLREETDPSLMGGVLLQMDGKRYDNTVRSRLNTIRQTMIGE